MGAIHRLTVGRHLWRPPARPRGSCPTLSEGGKKWEKEQKICRRTRRVFFSCCKKALLHKKQQRTCTKTRAAALHWRDRITRALRGDRAADGGHYKASAWKQCKKQWREAGFCTKREKALCRVQTAAAAVLRCVAVFADLHCSACRRVQRESSWSSAHSFLLFDLARVKVFSFLPPPFQGLFSWHQPSAYLCTF